MIRCTFAWRLVEFVSSFILSSQVKYFLLLSGHIWDVWLDMVSKFATSVPFMIGIGNHEYDHTSGGGNGKDPSGVETVGGYKPEWGNFLDDSNGECGIPPSKRFVMVSYYITIFQISFHICIYK
jgi:hypothetical protein